MTLDVTGYWMETSPPVYPSHREQEAALAEVLGSLDFASTLEVGCGDGRISALLPRPLTVLDLEPKRVAATAGRTGATGICSSLQDFTTDQRWDLVIAVEVLMHIPPSDIGQACDKLLALANRYVVTCDWTEPLRKQTAKHNWLHPYAELLRPTRSIPVGKQTIHVIDKEKA